MTNDNGVDKDKIKDQVLKQLASMLADAMIEKLADDPALRVKQFNVSAEDMAALLKLARAYERLMKLKQSPTLDQVRITGEALARIFDNAYPMTYEQCDMLVDAINLLEKQHDDEIASAKWLKEMSNASK